MIKQVKKVAGYLVLLTTILLFALYIRTNPEVIDQIAQTKIVTILAVLGLYSLMTVVLIIMSKLILNMSSIKLDTKPGERYISRVRSIQQQPIQDIFAQINQRINKELTEHPEYQNNGYGS